MTDLLALAGRVESLTGPCRETDALLALVAGCTEISYRVYRGPDGKYLGSAPYYTRSRDAAMTLRLDWMSVETLESAPEPQFTRCRVYDWRRSPRATDSDNEWGAEGNRPLPLNICAAILRARAALEASHG